MRAVLVVLLFLLAAFPARAGETTLAEPKPSWDNPRRVVLQLTSDDVRHVNNVLYNAINVQKFYGQDNVKVAIVAYASGVRALLKGESKVAERVASLQQYDVEFIACGNSLESMGKEAADLLPAIAVVPFGIPEIMERQMKGWLYIAP